MYPHQCPPCIPTTMTVVSYLRLLSPARNRVAAHGQWTLSRSLVFDSRFAIYSSPTPVYRVGGSMCYTRECHLVRRMSTSKRFSEDFPLAAEYHFLAVMNHSLFVGQEGAPHPFCLRPSIQQAFTGRGKAPDIHDNRGGGGLRRCSTIRVWTIYARHIS